MRIKIRTHYYRYYYTGWYAEIYLQDRISPSIIGYGHTQQLAIDEVLHIASQMKVHYG